MPVDTPTEKLAIMEWGTMWEPGLPLSPGPFTQADQQQLLLGYPGRLWEEPPPTILAIRATDIVITSASRAQAITFVV